ncbi:dTDP-4-amino-4,6-dideoxygalactose transaminase [Flavobacterium gillisiae]|uniref:dTDP-4-amino-4,6-dideoxygalactose transaminase n=1 Tax=Flavobacterium gillisiae TaxID=150146 RepID=A0A1H4EPT1_9FLAO|nr:DegT/DnrJ/EryC1/StrS aminotransferase family protein [Flavobacterium gillisiae]SEA87021.1 dTDP-4-amino-4,6-dideoxygalactose transaminase [Flavobacterium gillisiae]
MIPIYKPYMPEKIGDVVTEILYSGQLGYGNYGRNFESKLKSFVGCEFILSVSSYNVGMQIVLSTLGLQLGDEVIASPVSCLASNQPFAVKGLRVVWADVNALTGTMCPDYVRSKITKNTKAIFHNHFCGYLGNIDEINAIGKEFGIPVIDDGIEAFASRYKGKRLGNVGTDITVFSFQTVRLPNTIDGGAIVFKDKTLYEKALLIRDYGIDRTIFRTSNGEINPKCDIKIEGFAGLISELNSYIGIRQMEDIEKLLGIQHDNALVWNKKFENTDSMHSLVITSESIPNYWVYGTLCKNKIEAIKDFKQSGLYATGVHINNNVYSVFNNKIHLKGVEAFMKYFVAIPCGWWFNNK